MKVSIPGLGHDLGMQAEPEHLCYLQAVVFS